MHTTSIIAMSINPVIIDLVFSFSHYSGRVLSLFSFADKNEMGGTILDKKYYINTGGDGQLRDTSPAEVQHLVDCATESQKIALHFHGGLVDKNAGLKIAERLLPFYQSAGAHPVFFVWEAGLFEVIFHNLHEIGKEKIFKTILKYVMKHAVGKLTSEIGMKSGAGLTYPRGAELAIQLKKAEKHIEPYAEIMATSTLVDLSEAEEEVLKNDLLKDTDFQAEILSIASAALSNADIRKTGAKGPVISTRSSSRTLMSHDVVAEITEETEKGQKGLLSSAKIIFKVGKILYRVINRFVKNRDHGLYVTVVEEILRELYLANVGSEIWHQMKKETLDTFQSVEGEDRGGRLFVDLLGEKLKAGSRPEITLVGHSTGAVFILNLLKEVERCRNDIEHPWPQDVKFENVIFLAPACDFQQMNMSISNHRGSFKHFRMFAMDDEHEKNDQLVPVLYPRSLLYFVSGVVERNNEGENAFDHPIVGMERYYADTDVYTDSVFDNVRTFMDETETHTVWSVCTGQDDGLNADSTSHTGFDDFKKDEPNKFSTLNSVRHMIKYGA